MGVSWGYMIELPARTGTQQTLSKGWSVPATTAVYGRTKRDAKALTDVS